MTWRGSCSWMCALPSGALVALATPTAAQTLGQGSGLEIAWWRIVAAFLICAALAVAAAFALRTRMQASGAHSQPASGWRAVRNAIFSWPSCPEAGEPRLRLVETLRLGPQVDICLVQVDGRDFLVAMSPQGVSLLAGDAPVPRDAP